MPLNKILVIILLVFLNLVGYAQNDLSKPEAIFLEKQLLNDTSSKSFISLNGGFSINSTSINTDQLGEFIYSSTLDDDTKKSILSKVNSENRLGYGLDIGFTYKLKKNDHLNYVLGIYHKDIASISFSKSFANIALYGNKMYAGSTVDLAPINITNITYQQMYFGLEQKKANRILGFGISILNGTNYKQLNIEKAKIYTQIDGEYIDFDTDFEVRYNNNSKPNNGLGLSTSLAYKFFSAKHNLLINLSDLGFIKYNDLLTYGTNKKYNFEGIGIADIFNFNESAFSDINLTNIQSTLGITPQVKDVIVATPTTIRVDYLRSLGKLGIGSGIKHILFVSYNPKVYGRISYELTEKWWSAATVSYGGFGGVDYELAVGGQFYKKTYFAINLHFIEWLALPKQTSGLGVNAVISKFF
jgi:hypothetical protein